jgi:5-methylcytosine-specific restriction enzyme subunit McrC
MYNRPPIQVFEYQQLLIGEHGFLKSHWEALGYYNEVHGGDFFRLIPKGVKFHHFVGVLQVGNITIEILPKIGSVDNEDKCKWQKVLIDMLRECRWMQVYANEKAALRFKPNSILEAYLELFLLECEELIRQGLVKKYRAIEKNSGALKGKLLFNKQVRKNHIHQEKFFTRHELFDRENIFNQILLKALKLIPVISNSPFLKDQVLNLILSFPELEDIIVNPVIFQNLVYDRKTSRYKEAMEIAAMLLLNYRPDISTGHNHVLAILFNMNDLWEEYIFRQLYKNKPPSWIIGGQNRKKFWQLSTLGNAKTIKPDIVIHNKMNNVKVILDTKWKIPESNIPLDDDLKQMYIYNEYWCGKKAILVYPNAKFTDEPVYADGIFFKNDNTLSSHGCGVMKMSVLNSDNSKLDITIGKRINDFLKENILV